MAFSIAILYAVLLALITMIREVLHPLRGRRATIKAHPATPHRPRPYGKSSRKDEEPKRLRSTARATICYNRTYNQSLLPFPWYLMQINFLIRISERPLKADNEV
jgi:hypothetical protein